MVGEPGWERNVEPWCRGCEWQPFQGFQDRLLPFFLGPQFSVKWEELPLPLPRSCRTCTTFFIDITLLEPLIVPSFLLHRGGGNIEGRIWGTGPRGSTGFRFGSGGFGLVYRFASSFAFLKLLVKWPFLKPLALGGGRRHFPRPSRWAGSLC